MRSPKKALFICLILLVTVLQSPLAIIPLAHCAEGDYIDSFPVPQSGDAYGVTTNGTYIWVVDLNDLAVYRYNMTGGYLDSWSTVGHGTKPTGIGTDGTNIFITDYASDKVYVYTMIGGYLTSWSTSSGGSNPRCVTSDGEYIWTVDYVSNDVSKWTMAGGYLGSWDVSGEGGYRFGLTTDGINIWVIDGVNLEVDKYDMVGGYLTSWSTAGHGANPRGIATDGINIWISDLVNIVYKFEGPPLPISPPSDPIDLFGAGFNDSSPYVELHWNHSLVDVQFFEVQNSTDKVSWDYLGQTNTANYTDLQVVNGTERYYRVRACNFTDGDWYNSSFTDVNFETVYFVMPSGAGECVGWLSGWDNRVKITIDSGDIGAYLSNFPVLIYLSNSSGINGDNVSFVFDEVGGNSLKIAVTLSDGLTECYVEIEKWDLGNREAWLWTKITSIGNASDTEIYLYYDNDYADNGAYVGLTNSAVAENVWDSDFLMVQHQAGDSSPIRDSTSSDTDMTEGGDPTYLQAGPIDGEIDYDGNDYHLSAINVFDAIVGTDKGTMSLWIKTTTSVAASHVPLNIEGAYVMLFRIGEGGLLKTFWSGTHFDSARTTTQINTGAQFYIVSTYDGSNQRVYVNGNLEATDACNLYDITALNRATGLASNWDGSTSIDANIDDVRVSKINRSPSWIVASYETGRDDLLDFGLEEEAPACEEVAPAQAMGKFYALAIILLILGLLIGLGMRRR